MLLKKCVEFRAASRAKNSPPLSVRISSARRCQSYQGKAYNQPAKDVHGFPPDFVSTTKQISQTLCGGACKVSTDPAGFSLIALAQ